MALAVVTFAYTLKMLTKNALLMTTVEPVFTYSATTTVEILTIIVATLFTIRKISSMQLGDARTIKSLFVKIVVIFIILTIIQFLISLYLPEIYYHSDIYIDNSEKYWDFIGGNNLTHVKIIVDILPYFIVGLIFWKTK